MTEVLRLIGLTQDGAMLPAVLVGVVVWMTITVRQMRSDVEKLSRDHDSMDATLRRVAEDVAYLRGQADRGKT